MAKSDTPDSLLREARTGVEFLAYDHPNSETRLAALKLLDRIDTAIAARPVPAQPAMQGGLSNDELRKAWNRKLPGVDPTDKRVDRFRARG